MHRRLSLLAVAVLLVAAGCGGSDAPSGAVAAPAAAPKAPAAHASATTPTLRDWPLFGLTPARPDATSRPTGVTAADLGSLTRRQVTVPGTVDSSPLLLFGVRIGGAARDLVLATTTYGRTVAIDAATGRILWTFSPPDFDTWAGSAQITNATPAVDPSRTAVFTASPDGRIHKLSVTTGRELPHFPVAVTKDPSHEKLTSSLNISGPDVVVTTGGYVGDAPPYQGHVVTLDRRTGARHGVFNSLCSTRHTIIAPSSCRSSDSAIWGRAGAVVLPGSRDLLVATSNGPFDGATDWGDSVLRLSPTADTLKAHWTPAAQATYEAQDIDVGSVSPVLLGGGLVMQSGKDAKMHLLTLRGLHGVSGAAGRRLGGDRQVLSTPGGQMMFSAPAVWRHGTRTTMFATTGGGTAAYAVRGGRLRQVWANAHAGTSPVLAGGLLYVYDPGGGLRVYVPGTGRQLAQLPAGPGHWNSPVVAGGRIVLPEGNANDHRTSGTIDIWTRR